MCCLTHYYLFINNHQMIFILKQFCGSLQKMKRKVNNSSYKAKCYMFFRKRIQKFTKDTHAMHFLYSKEKIADKLALQTFL